MKIIFKILLAPIVIVLDLFTWLCIGLISCSAILFRLTSSIVALLGVAVLVTCSVKNGLILLTIAFLVSPLGLSMLAIHILSFFQSFSRMLKSI